jgi:hypothetical protein
VDGGTHVHVGVLNESRVWSWREGLGWLIEEELEV